MNPKLNTTFTVLVVLRFLHVYVCHLRFFFMYTVLIISCSIQYSV